MKTLSATVFGLCILGAATPAAALEFSDLTRLPNAALADLRGGLVMGGLKFDLTAHMRTYVDERLALATEVKLSRQGDADSVLQQRLARIPGNDRPAAASPAPQASAPDNAAAPGSPAASQPPAPTPPPTPTVINDSVGGTTIRHAVTHGGLISAVGNTASHRSVHQQVDIELTVHNFSDFARTARNALHARAMGRLLAPR